MSGVRERYMIGAWGIEGTQKNSRAVVQGGEGLA